jgi:hypothetical protein
VSLWRHPADRIYGASKVDPEPSFTEEPGSALLAVAVVGRQEEDDARRAASQGARDRCR